MIITYAMRVNRGERQYSEDSVRAVRVGSEWLFVLADGLGGMGHGEIASETAVESAINRFQWDPDRRQVLCNCINSAQEAVRFRQKDNTELTGMATTFVGLRLLENQAEWVHIGDSRLYLFRNGVLSCRTLDHSVPPMLVNAGMLSPDQIRHHPDRSRLMRIIGNEWEDEDNYTFSQPIEIQEGDSFLLCSDGLWEWVDERVMEALLKESESPLRWLSCLEKAAVENGKGKNLDNYSGICVYVR